MGQPVVHFEIIGRDPARLRRFYTELFGWELDPADAVTDTVSEPGQYGFLDASKLGDVPVVNGGVGGGPGHQPHTIFYIGVPDVADALKKAESLGATRTMGPEGVPGQLVVGQFTDPEGNLIGVAGDR
jgi:hypothetical protein